MKILSQFGRIVNLDSPFFETIHTTSDTRDGKTVYDVEASIMSPTGSMHSHLLKANFPDIESARGFIKVIWDAMKHQQRYFDVSEH